MPVKTEPPAAAAINADRFIVSSLSPLTCGSHLKRETIRTVQAVPCQDRPVTAGKKSHGPAEQRVSDRNSEDRGDLCVRVDGSHFLLHGHGLDSALARDRSEE